MPYAKPNTNQDSLFGEKTEWETEWEGMPEFVQENLLPAYSVKVNFTCIEDLQRFAKLIDQPLTTKTQSVWFPAQERRSSSKLRYV